VGLPVYKGTDLIAKCLDCLQRQTFGDFEAIISVDGGDAETAAACRPFLVDPRFRMVIQPERLGFSGNFNWLLKQDLREFFCYRQHDDTTVPEFFEFILQTADRKPNAAAVYCDCQYIGGLNHIEIAQSIEGEPLDRMLKYIERLPATPLRGLIRSAAIRHAGPMRSSDAVSEYDWLAKLVRWGNFRRVAKPLYYKLDRAHTITNDWHSCPEERKRAAWSTVFTGLLEAAMPLCRTPEERQFFQQTIFDRIVVYPSYIYRATNRPNLEKLIAECLARLRDEGNTHLLDAEELPAILQKLRSRLSEAHLLEQSRVRRGIYKVRQRFRIGNLIYPESRLRRIKYQARELLDMSRQEMSRLLQLQ
jgi:glycosyltransferase involved in cell wall biosynthesis